MSVDIKTLKHIAKLAHVNPAHNLSEEEAEAAFNSLTKELDDLVTYISALAEADTDGVEPLYSLMFDVPPPRADEPRASGLTRELLDQAPDRIGDFFAVPKVI